MSLLIGNGYAFDESEKDFKSLQKAFDQLDNYSRAEIAWLALVDCAGDEASEYIAKRMGLPYFTYSSFRMGGGKRQYPPRFR